jgi:hypothetical protein
VVLKPPDYTIQSAMNFVKPQKGLILWRWFSNPTPAGMTHSGKKTDTSRYSAAFFASSPNNH